MKRVLFIVVLVGLVFTGQAAACSLCDDLRASGYTDGQISQVIRSSASRAEAESKLRKLISERRPPKKEPLKAIVQAPPPSTPARDTASGRPYFVAAGSQEFQYSHETIDVPADERR